jgi:uncharacterized protein with von Willebrand factor type A (vWA) domain
MPSPSRPRCSSSGTRAHDRRPALVQIKELHRNSRRLHWLNPEPHVEWDTGDLPMSAYGAHRTGVFELSKLGRLADGITAVA